MKQKNNLNMIYAIYGCCRLDSLVVGRQFVVECLAAMVDRVCTCNLGGTLEIGGRII